MGQRLKIEDVEGWAAGIVAEMAEDAIKYFGDDSDPNSWTTVVLRDDIDGFGEYLSPKARSRLSSHQRGSRRRKFGKRLDMARSLVTNARSSLADNDREAVLKQLCESINAEVAPWGQITTSLDALKMTLAECARRGDTSWDTLDSGGSGLYLILTCYAD